MLTGLGLLSAPAVHADEDKAPPSGRSTGSRGCGTLDTLADLDRTGSHLVPAGDAQDSAQTPAAGATLSSVPALILLAPSQQRSQTVSHRPTFAWFVRTRESRPLEFRIYERVAGGYELLKEIKGRDFRSTPGIMVMSALNGLPELTPGKHYRWQVEMVCNASRPSGNVFAEAEIAVVPLQAEVKQQLAAVEAGAKPGSDLSLRYAQVYAQANLWYDALGSMVSALNHGEGNPSGKNK